MVLHAIYWNNVIPSWYKYILSPTPILKPFSCFISHDWKNKITHNFTMIHIFLFAVLFSVSPPPPFNWTVLGFNVLLLQVEMGFFHGSQGKHSRDPGMGGCEWHGGIYLGRNRRLPLVPHVSSPSILLWKFSLIFSKPRNRANVQRFLCHLFSPCLLPFG